MPHPILVCTYTNVAVDNLVDGLVSSGVKALRVGFGGSVRGSVLGHTLDHKLSTHPLQHRLLELVKQEEALGARIADLEIRLREVHAKELEGNAKAISKGERMQKALLAMQREHSTLKSRKYAIQQEMLRDVISEADVVRLKHHLFLYKQDHFILIDYLQICTTCITSACVALNVTDFPIVFLDEASMSTEPASLIPIMKGV